jgi:hypothetical protein
LAPAAAKQQPPASSPDSVITELYKVHRNGRGPVFSTKGRRYITKYFDKRLANLLWKEIAGTPSGEVGNLDFDPLYNAQDTQITHFLVGKPKFEGDKALVVVSFNNFNQKTRITFRMLSTAEGWKIENLIYGDGSDLIKILSATR